MTANYTTRVGRVSVLGRTSVRTLHVLIAAVVAAAGALGFALPAHADVAPDRLVASLTVTDPNYTTVEAVFSALGSNGGDIRGINSFVFDYGDGTPPVSQDSAVASHTYATPGTYRATVTITSDYGITASAAASVAVESIDKIGRPLFPAEGAPSTKAALDRTTVQPGGTVTVHVPKVRGGLEFGAELVPPAKTDPWFTPSIATGGPYKTASGDLTVPRNAKPGLYTVTVRVSDGSMTALKLRVEKTPLALINTALHRVGGITGLGCILGLLGLVITAAIILIRARRSRAQAAAA